MIDNETMRSILARRSYKVFDSRSIDDEALETIITAGLYAPTGMNRQPWHFTVIKSKEMLEKFGAARRSLPLPPGIPPEAAAKFGDPMRNAPVMIIVSAKEGGTAFEDCCLAMENMFIAAASLGYGVKIISSPTRSLNGADHDQICGRLGVDPSLTAVAVLLVGKPDQSVDGVSGASVRSGLDEKTVIVG